MLTSGCATTPIESESECTTKVATGIENISSSAAEGSAVMNSFPDPIKIELPLHSSVMDSSSRIIFLLLKCTSTLSGVSGG